MRLVLTTALLASALHLVPATHAEAQVRFIPQVGLYAPVTDLNPGLGGAQEIGKKESTLALGLALDTRSSSVLGVRLGGMYGSSSDVPIRGVGCDLCEARNSVLALTGAVVIRPLPGLPLLRPYGLIGAGAKWYSFEAPEGEDELQELLDTDPRLAFQLGAGVELNLGIFSLNLELSDYVSSFEVEGLGGAAQRQHDMVFSVGLVLGG
jgi:hypothetical protein